MRTPTQPPLRPHASYSIHKAVTGGKGSVGLERAPGNRCCGSRIRCLCWPLNPGWIKNQSLETIFWLKILKFFYADSGCKKFGSGMGKIQIRDSQHCGESILILIDGFLYGLLSVSAAWSRWGLSEKPCGCRPTTMSTREFFRSSGTPFFKAKRRRKLLASVIRNLFCGSRGGSGSVGSVRFWASWYRSGYLYHQAKIVKKTLIPTVLWLFLWLLHFRTSPTEWNGMELGSEALL